MGGVGAEVKRLRQAKGWTQEQLAVYAGSSQPTVNLLEAGKRNPSAATLAKIAGALGVEVGDFFPKGQPPLPLDLEQRQESAQRLRDAGISETTARGVSGVDSRPEAYWHALAESARLESKPDDGTAEKLLGFGERMVAWWESELPERLEAEDEEWLRHIWSMYHEFIDILNGIKPGAASHKNEPLSQHMDIHAAAFRILSMVHFHNARSREAGKKELALAKLETT